MAEFMGARGRARAIIVLPVERYSQLVQATKPARSVRDSVGNGSAKSDAYSFALLPGGG